MPTFLDPPVDVTPSTFGVYTDIDVSAHVLASATGVVVRVSQDGGVGNTYSLRRKGASDDHYHTINTTSHNWEPVPLDAARVFQARLQSSALHLELVGWFGPEATWPAEPLDISPLPWGTGYRDIDIAALTGADTAKAAMLLFRDTAVAQVFARAKGSTADLRAYTAGRQPVACAVNASEVLQATCGKSSGRLALRGWLTDGLEMHVNPVNVTPGSAGEWTTHALPAGASGGIFWARRDGGDVAEWGARKKNSGLDWTGGMNLASGLAIVGADGGEVELYRESDIEIYRLGWFFAVDSYAGQPESLEEAGEIDLPAAVVGDIYSGQPENLEESGEIDLPSAGGLRLDTRLPVTALVARPYDPAVEVALQGPPAPIGAVEIGGIDYVSFGAETVVTAADATYDSQAGDDPPSTPFPGRLMEVASLELRAFDGDRPGGASNEALGGLMIGNGDGRYDAAALLGWDGRLVEIWQGRVGMAFRDFRLLLRGTAARVGFTEDSITIALRSRGAVFDQAINGALFGGSGGLDGHEGIAGLNKPKALGRPGNVPLVNIDPVNLVFQAHDGRMEAFEAVRDKGALLTPTVDVPFAVSAQNTYAALLAVALEPGEYATCLALGLVRLGGSPVGQVTADIRGDASGSGYVETVADIARRVVTRMLVGRNLTESELDLAALAALNEAQPAPMGYWAGTAPVTAREVLDKMLGGIGGWHGFTRDGRFTVERLSLDGTPGATIAPRNVADRAPAEKVSVAPIWQVLVGWGRVWAVQSADALAGDVSDEDRAFWSKEVRYAPAQNSSIRGRHRHALPLRVEAYFAERSDAETEAARLLALYGPDREIWTVPLAGAWIGRHWPGDLVTFDLGRYGQPKASAVIGLMEDYARKEVDLVLWG